MANVWYVFQACGWMSSLCLLASIVGIALACVAIAMAGTRARAARRMAWASLVFALAPAGLGLIGVGIGRAKVDTVLSMPGLNTYQRDGIRELGYREAGGCAAVGTTLTAPPLLLAGIAVAMAQLLRRRDGEQGL